jgi:hypothetical protein
LGVVAVQLVLARGLLRGELPGYRDLSRLFIPLKWHISQELREGRLPEWWPWDGLGMPLASQPMASLFHPSTVLYAVLPFQPAFALQLFLPLPFAAWGTFRLGRALGLGPWAAALAGAAYTLSGYFLSLTEFTFSSLSAAALPFVALGALRLATPRPRLGALALAVALLFLGGDPVLAYLGVGTASVLCMRPGPPRKAARAVAWLALAVALGALVAAVQLGPTASLYLESSRSRGTVHGSSFWALGSTQLWGFLRPPSDAPPFLFRSTYLGAVVCALAILGASVRARLRAGLVVVAGLSLGLALGDALPLWKAATALVPGWSAFRFPAKAMGPFVLAVALLAGRGAQQMGRRLGQRQRWALPALLAVVAVDLGLGNAFLLETQPLAETPSLMARLRQLGVAREGPSYAWRWHLPAGAPESTRAQLLAGAPASGALYGLPTSNAYLPGFSAEYGELNVRSMWTWLGPLAGLFGSRYLVVPPTEVDGPVVAMDVASGAVVQEIPAALPRAYLASGVVRVPRALVSAALKEGRFRPGLEVLLAAEDDGPPARAAAGPMRPAPVRVVGEALEVRVTAEVPSVLVLNEAYFRGVRAFEGERELSVLRVNHLVRGVALDAGPHTVRFEFETPALLPGAVVSLLGVGLLVALWLWRRRCAVRW